jgi:multiple sugar transport system permease protein
VSLFHFFFAWNDFFGPLIYLVSAPELWPLSVGLQRFNATYGRMPNLIQTGALITLVLPVIIFFVAQRVFMQGIVFSGVEK